MNSYPSLDALRKKDAGQAVNEATSNTKDKSGSSLAQNPLAVKKIKRRRKRRTALKVTVLVIALFFVTGTVFAARMLTVGGGFFDPNGPDGFFSQLSALFGNSTPLEGESEDRVNFLVLGHGGEGHDGPNLTDTVILASYRPSDQSVALLSLPRDLYVNVPNFGYSKLNSAFAMGEESGFIGGGSKVTTETVEEITGQEIPYYVTMDFKGFEQIVDQLGGLDIDVPKAFYDDLHAISYEKGENHFSGSEALYFTRARYVTNPPSEGGDFARAARTQLVGLALRDRALQLNPITDIASLTGIMQSVGDHVRTNLSPEEIRRVYELVHDISPESIQTRVIDDAETALVYGDSGMVGGVSVSVLKPNDPTYDEIQDYVDGMFDPLPPEAENATLEVHNGTEEYGLAGQFTEIFSLGSSLTLLGVDNAKQSDYEETFIVDNTDGEKPQSLELLQFFIKRIIGLPGETVRLSEGDLFIDIDGQEYHLDESAYLQPGVQTTGNDQETVIGEDEFFVLGDNRGASSDSRVWGAVPKDDLVGRVWLRAWPFDVAESFEKPEYEFLTP